MGGFCREVALYIVSPLIRSAVLMKGYTKHFLDTFEKLFQITVKILGNWMARTEQTVQTLIRQLQKEQSDQGWHCLLFQRHLLDALITGIILSVSFFKFLWY